MRPNVTVCVQCEMTAFLRGDPQPVFEETPDAHMARVHPHGVTPEERRELVAQLRAKLAAAPRKEA